VCVLLLCVGTRVPVTGVLFRVWQLSPMLVGVSLAPAASHGFSAGWDLTLILLLRGVASLIAACWLTTVTPFADLMRLLKACRAPQAFVEVLSLTHRYVSVLSDELRQMRTAQRARTFGGESTWQAWRRRSQLVAALLSRSMNRAERVHLAMQARGYRGDRREPQ
jgi:cobalt/nickel transport system permease protein